MTQEFQTVIRLAIAGSLGCCAENIPENIDWDKVEKLARDHAVLPLVGYALRCSPFVPCSSDVRSSIIGEMREVAVSNHMWKSATLSLLAKMHSQGIPALLIKGYSVASCYAAPDCRLSGDADLLIPTEYEKKACMLLEREGFQIIPRWEHWHHTECVHPVIGCVELHVQLYDEFVEDFWFGNVQTKKFVLEEPVSVRTEEYQYQTLGYTDHLLFLILHLVKHFIMTGMSLRMMIDAVLFFRKHAAQIDEKRLWDTIAGLGFETVVTSIFAAIVQYGDLDCAGLLHCEGVDSQKVEWILNDLEQGGWLGYKNKQDRAQGGHAYNRHRIISSKGKPAYMLYMLRMKVSRCLFVLFPPVKMLKKQYPCCEKHWWYLPAAWSQYVVYRLKRAFQRKSFSHGIIREGQKISDSAESRMELFKKLDIL